MSALNHEDGSNAPKRIAVYVRVSTAKQAATNDSLRKQERESRLYSQSQGEVGGWVVEAVSTYTDTGKSGQSVDRPALQQLMADVRSGAINTVITYTMDRISRDIQDFMLLCEFFQEHGVHFQLIRDQFDSSSDLGRAMVTILSAFAQREAKNRGRLDGGQQ